jgi:hypothetical protein
MIHSDINHSGSLYRSSPQSATRNLPFRQFKVIAWKHALHEKRETLQNIRSSLSVLPCRSLHHNVPPKTSISSCSATLHSHYFFLPPRRAQLHRGTDLSGSLQTRLVWATVFKHVSKDLESSRVNTYRVCTIGAVLVGQLGQPLPRRVFDGLFAAR